MEEARTRSVLGRVSEVDAATFTASSSAPMTVPASSRHFGPQAHGGVAPHGVNPVIRVDPKPLCRWGRPERLLLDVGGAGPSGCSSPEWGRPERLFECPQRGRIGKLADRT